MLKAPGNRFQLDVLEFLNVDTDLASAHVIGWLFLHGMGGVLG